jgi:hypothetical protein
MPDDDEEVVVHLRLFALGQGDYRIVEAFSLLGETDKALLKREFTASGCKGQRFQNCEAVEEGPVLELPGLSMFLQTQANTSRENTISALVALCQVIRTVRTWFPLVKNQENTKVTMSLKAIRSVNVDELLEPAPGDLWLLLRQGPSEIAISKMSASRLNELNKEGTSFLLLDFSGTEATLPEEAAVASRPNFNGKWKCINTWGMDEFLQGMGVGRLQRMAAGKAPWPSWSFVQDNDDFTFTNHSALGELREMFIVDGPGYTTIDGWKREIQCAAIWDNGSLVITRKGPEGSFREDRFIDETDNLRFTLAKLSDKGQPVAEWGRVFERMVEKA